MNNVEDLFSFQHSTVSQQSHLSTSALQVYVVHFIVGLWFRVGGSILASDVYFPLCYIIPLPSVLKKKICIE